MRKSFYKVKFGDYGAAYVLADSIVEAEALLKKDRLPSDVTVTSVTWIGEAIVEEPDAT